MGRNKSRRSGKGDTPGPRRGKRRSIRYESQEEWPEDRPSGRADDAPPQILLRKLTLDEALQRLEFQLRGYARQGQTKVLVVHGKGTNSLRGISVLGPAVREWCNDHRGLVGSWQEAPGKWGGAGAIVVILNLTKD